MRESKREQCFFLIYLIFLFFFFFFFFSLLKSCFDQIEASNEWKRRRGAMLLKLKECRDTVIQRCSSRRPSIQPTPANMNDLSNFTDSVKQNNNNNKTKLQIFTCAASF